MITHQTHTPVSEKRETIYSLLLLLLLLFVVVVVVVGGGGVISTHSTLYYMTIHASLLVWAT